MCCDRRQSQESPCTCYASFVVADAVLQAIRGAGPPHGDVAVRVEQLLPHDPLDQRPARQVVDQLALGVRRVRCDPFHALHRAASGQCHNQNLGTNEG